MNEMFSFDCKDLYILKYSDYLPRFTVNIENFVLKIMIYN